MRRALLIGLCAVLTGNAQAATVLSVGDGDTIRVSEQGQRLTIRLACIDAPEMAQSPYGEASRQRLQKLAEVGSEVTLKAQTIDKYGRTVAEVFRSGQSINLEMVRSGQAFAYRKYLAACDAPSYLQTEAEAERQRIGVWSVPGGIKRPWDWRHGSRGPGQAQARGADRRYTCRQAGSFERAQELLRQGHTYLDRNGDGIACESLR
jgi:endonuclease YncB( thermonuclease family)